MLALLSVVAGVVVVFLGWNLYRRFGADRIAELNERRRLTARIVSRGELVDVLPNDVVARWHMMLPPRREPVRELVPQTANAI